MDRWSHGRQCVAEAAEGEHPGVWVWVWVQGHLLVFLWGFGGTTGRQVTSTELPADELDLVDLSVHPSQHRQRFRITRLHCVLLYFFFLSSPIANLVPSRTVTRLSPARYYL